MFANLLLSCLVFSAVATAELESNQELSHTVKFLQEQVQALLKHRQEDYNALEESLKQSMEKNTELLILRDEVKQMRQVAKFKHVQCKIYNVQNVQIFETKFIFFVCLQF